MLGGFYIYKEYTRTSENLVDVKADFSIGGKLFLDEFLTNDSNASKKYLGKIVEVSGEIKEMTTDENNFYTIALGDTASLSSIRCRLDSSENKKTFQIKKMNLISIKGICTGYIADEFGIGSDIQLDRCVLVIKNN